MKMKKAKHTFINRFGDYLAQRDGGYFCHYCGIPLKRAKLSKSRKVALLQRLGYGIATIDHVVPLCKGGSRKPENMILACYDCNDRKGDSSYESFLRTLEYSNALKSRNQQNQSQGQRG